MFGSLGICSKPNSEHVPGNSEHLDALRAVAGSVRSVRKAPRKIVEATILRLCEGRYQTLDDPASRQSRLHTCVQKELSFITCNTHAYRLVSGL